MRYLIAALFASAGVGLGAVNVWNNAMAINGGAWVLNDLTLLVAGLAIASALLSAGAGAMWSRSAMVGALCVLAIIGCTLTSVGYTLGRVGHVADQRASEALAHNANLARAEATVARLVGEAKAEAARGGCGPRCRSLKADVAAAEAALAALGARMVVDPAGERVEAVTAGMWSADHYRTSHPVITAVTLELCVALLLSVAGLIWAPARVTRVEVLHPQPVDPIVRALEVAGPACNRDLARLVGMDERRVSERAKQLEHSGRVVSRRSGKMRVYALA